MQPWSWQERERESEREGDNKRKDGNNDIKHRLINEDSRDAPPRLPLMSINSVIWICNLLFANTVSLLSFK